MDVLEISIKDNESKKLEVVEKLINNYLLVEDLANNLIEIDYYEEFEKNNNYGEYERIKKHLDDFELCLVGSLSALAQDIASW